MTSAWHVDPTGQQRGDDGVHLTADQSSVDEDRSTGHRSGYGR